MGIGEWSGNSDRNWIRAERIFLILRERLAAVAARSRLIESPCWPFRKVRLRRKVLLRWPIRGSMAVLRTNPRCTMSSLGRQASLPHYKAEQIPSHSTPSRSFPPTCKVLVSDQVGSVDQAVKKWIVCSVNFGISSRSLYGGTSWTAFHAIQLRKYHAYYPNH